MSPGPRIWICALLGVVWCPPLQLGWESQGDAATVEDSNWRRFVWFTTKIRKTRIPPNKGWPVWYMYGEFVYSKEDSRKTNITLEKEWLSSYVGILLELGWDKTGATHPADIGFSITCESWSLSHGDGSLMAGMMDDVFFPKTYMEMDLLLRDIKARPPCMPTILTIPRNLPRACHGE